CAGQTSSGVLCSLLGTEAQCGYVIILMAVYWCTEVIPLAVTALLPVILFPMFGILESKKVCMQYLKDTNMLFVGGLIVALAVEHWNLHKRIALRVLLIVGVKPALLMLGFMGVTAFLSMWISNTATTAMMVPIVQAVLDQMNSSEHEVVISDQPIGQVNSGIELEEKNAMGPVSVQGTWQVQMLIRAEKARQCYDTATETFSSLFRLFPQNGDILNFASWFGFAFPNMILMLTLAWFWLQFSFMGFNFRKTWGCGTERTEKEKAALKVLKDEHRKLGPISFAEFSILMLFILLILLWFTRDPGFISGWATTLFNKERECKYWDTNLQPQNTPLLDWKVVQKKMPWNIVLLLGGGFALANGSDASGLSKWLGDQMMPLHSVPSWAIAVILSLTIAVFTECTSNVATATLFLPVFASLSQSIEINPLYIMIPCTLSASFAFMLPVATPPNAIVFSYGHLRVSDMSKTGIVMNIIGVLCITLAINTWGRAMFHLDTFPTWANTTGGK
uniref:Solute carrier family 13 member 5 n=1 Tax=Sphenodon punctatus TaxID=8508 RepID=A0A8D0G971_SPHPU